MKRNLFVVFLTLIIQVVFVYNLSATASKKSDEGFNVDFEMLRKECNNSGCCLASLETIKRGGFYFADQDKNLVDIQCPDGYFSNMMRCPDSYRWCQPEEGLQEE